MNVTHWLHAVALMSLDLANGAYMVRDDTNSVRTFTESEHATIKRWIADFERIQQEASAMLRDWTAIPGDEDSSTKPA